MALHRTAQSDTGCRRLVTTRTSAVVTETLPELSQRPTHESSAVATEDYVDPPRKRVHWSAALSLRSIALGGPLLQSAILRHSSIPLSSAGADIRGSLMEPPTFDHLSFKHSQTPF
jgi:hypothetical protein